ncbi:MAG: ATP-binding protein [Prochloraceae cyanobacterium]
MNELSTLLQFSNLDRFTQQEYYAKKMQDTPKSNQAIQQEIIEIIQTSQDTQTLLSRLATKLGEIFCADTCLIVAGVSTITPGQIGFWHVGNSHMLLPETNGKLRSHPLMANVLAETEPLAISDLQATDNNHLANWPRELLPGRALLRIATHFQGTANGTILIGQSQPREWTSRDKENLKIASESVAIAISLVQLQQQNQSSKRYQTLIKEIGEAIRYNVDINSLLKKALQGTAKVLQVDRAWILLLKYKSPPIKGSSNQEVSQIEAQVVCQWSQHRDLLQSPMQSFFSLFDSPLCTQAFKVAPDPLALEAAAHFPDVAKLNSTDDFNSGTSSALLMIPLIGSMTSDSKPGIVLGFLVLQASQRRIWKADEIELVNWIGTQVSTSILHDQALNKVQSLVDKRTSQLKWSLEVQAKLSEGMRQHIEQLQNLNKLKDEFVDSIGHELKTPLTKMKLALTMLRQSDKPPESKARYLDILEEAYNREEKLIKDLLTLQKLESNQFTSRPQQFELKDLITDLAQSFPEQFEQQWSANEGNKELSLVVNYRLDSNSKTSPNSSLMLYTDPKSLKQILSELLTNAGKYADSNTTIYLDVTRKTSSEGNQILLTLTDYGRGISPEEQSYIFDKFRRGNGITEQAIPGMGIGLTLVKYLVQNLNGTIDVSSDPSENPATFVTSFTVTLPQVSPENQ